VINQETDRTLQTEPRFFYGYVVVVAAFLIMIVSFGLHNTFGVFFKPLLTEFGWSRATASGAFSLSMLLFGILSIAMGGLNDRFGPRVVLTFCGFFLGLGYLLMSRTSALWQLYMFFGVLVGIGIGGVWVPLLSSVARWFVKRRSLMTGVVVAGVGSGGLMAPPLISRLIATYDWRLAYIIIGSTVLLFMISAAQFLKREPAQMGLLPYGEGKNEGKQPGLNLETGAYSLRESVYTAQFWIIFAMFFFYGFVVFAILVHIVPHAIEVGISAISAANILAIIGGVGIPGNLLMGSLGDRIGNRWIFITGFTLMIAALFWLVVATEVWMLYLFAVVFGFAFGGMATSGSPIIARLFGLSSHGLIFGVVGLGFRIGAAVGPFVTGYIFDVTGSYQAAFMVCAAFIVASLILIIILRPTRKLGGTI